MTTFYLRPALPKEIEAYEITGYIANSKRALLEGYDEPFDFILTDAQIDYIKAVDNSHKPMWGIVRGEHLEVVVNAYFKNNNYHRVYDERGLLHQLDRG